MAIFAKSAKSLTAEWTSSFLRQCKGFDQNVAKVNFIKTGNGACLAELKVEEEHTNPFKTLHGACIATLVDTLTTYALMTSEQCPKEGHVSVNMNISYIKGAKIGDEILINARTVRIGKTMAHLICDISNKATGEILAQANQRTIIGTITHPSFWIHKPLFNSGDFPQYLAATNFLREADYFS